LRLARSEVGGEEVAAQVVPVVADVVKRQVEVGLDCIGDGETRRAAGDVGRLVSQAAQTAQAGDVIE
jgi:methionine synthase II (cobalamin-independent)